MTPPNMEDMSTMDLTAMGMALTPEEIAQAKWDIATTGQITFHDFRSKRQLAYLLFPSTDFFAIKSGYFAPFYPLLRAMAKGIIYFHWFAVASSAVSWLFLVIREQLIACPYVEKAAAKCFPELPVSKQAVISLS
ncbi:hypothetical protein K469DRAFT_692869 [Zopfia rhizophila CBS 207.26]|uniref:Uncharacterized protein n=1 Tax=Zopfia rhizophila CBS 207.26 TaxID=1314779 RepID=A0A6A6DQ54_9PEZI|nr:hypothetical protein K469DRAFT_692869 [Zopfia rhizophila CBS 207.26]